MDAGDFEGLASAEDCLDLCYDTEGCQWMTYFGDTGFCVLLEDCQDLDECAECTVANADSAECSGDGDGGDGGNGGDSQTKKTRKEDIQGYFWS